MTPPASDPTPGVVAGNDAFGAVPTAGSFDAELAKAGANPERAGNALTACWNYKVSY